MNNLKSNLIFLSLLALVLASSSAMAVIKSSGSNHIVETDFIVSEYEARDTELLDLNVLTDLNIPDNSIATSKFIASGADGLVATVESGILKYKTPAVVVAAPNTVTEQTIINRSITEIKIQDNAVTNQKLANNSITNDRIKDNSIDANKIADNSIGAGDLNSEIVFSANAAVPANLRAGPLDSSFTIKEAFTFLESESNSLNSLINQKADSNTTTYTGDASFNGGLEVNGNLTIAGALSSGTISGTADEVALASSINAPANSILYQDADNSTAALNFSASDPLASQRILAIDKLTGLPAFKVLRLKRVDFTVTSNPVQSTQNGQTGHSVCATLFHGFCLRSSGGKTQLGSPSCDGCECFHGGPSDPVRPVCATLVTQ